MASENEVNAKKEEAHEAAKKRMVYNPTFRSMFGLTFAVSLIALALLAGTLTSGRPFPALFALPFIAVFLAIRFRMKLVVNNDKIEYTGLISTRTIALADITQAGWAYEQGYTRDRFFGSAVYEIVSRHDIIRINFRFFPLDQMTGLIPQIESIAVQNNAQN